MNNTNPSFAINFKFPDGCKEAWRVAEMPCVPRIGERIQGARPQSGCYRVASVTHDIFSDQEENHHCSAITVVLEALDEINYDINRPDSPGR